MGALKIYQGGAAVTLAKDLSLASKLRMYDGSNVIAIPLIATTSNLASALRIYNGDAVKALAKTGFYALWTADVYESDGHNGATLYDSIAATTNVVSSGQKDTEDDVLKFFTTDGDWLPTDLILTNKKIETTGDWSDMQGGGDPHGALLVIYRVYYDTSVDIFQDVDAADYGANYQPILTSNTKTFFRVDATHISIAGVSTEISAAATYTIETVTYTNYDSNSDAYGWYKVKNTDPSYFDVMIYGDDYDEDNNSAKVRIISSCELT